MKNISKNVLTKAVWGLIMGLFLTGPVFGDESAPVKAEGAPAVSAPVEQVKPEGQPPKSDKKQGRRKHKHSKKEAAPVAPVAPESK